MALGDAAAAYDPLSSHGVASAMASGFYGGHAIADFLAGRAEAPVAYLDVMQRAYGSYLDLQREHYGRETRWPDAPFWSRRHAPSYGLVPLESRASVRREPFSARVELAVGSGATTARSALVAGGV